MSTPNPLSVLLVDDSPIVRQPLRHLLEQVPSVQVVGEAGTGAQALLLFRVTHPDLVLLDIGLPDMSGLTLLTHLKREQPTCIVIMFTSHDSVSLRDVAARLGANHFFHKTSEFERAIHVVRTLAADKSG